MSEAYSSRYKSAVQSHIFHRAVKRYRKRARVTNACHKHLAAFPPPSPADTASFSTHAPFPDGQKRVQERLEELPRKILGHARIFHDDVQYFLAGGSQDAGDAELPVGLKKLLKDVFGSQRLAERIRGEILKDPDTKHVSHITIQVPFNSFQDADIIPCGRHYSH